MACAMGSILALLCSFDCLSIRGAGAVEFSGSAHDMDRAVHGVAIDSAAEGDRVTRLGAEDDVLLVDRTLERSRLKWPLEMSGENAAILLQGDVVGMNFSGFTPRRHGPFTGDVG